VPLPACASTILATGDLDRIGDEFAGFVAQGYRMVKGGWGHDLSIAFGSDERRDRRSRARCATRSAGRPHDRRRRADGLGREPRHPDVPGDRRRRGPLLFEDPLVEHDLDGYRLHARWTPHLHGRGLACGALSPDRSGAIDVIMIDPGRAKA
jgi:hypothetical protein